MPTYFPDIHAAGAGIEVKSLEAAMQVVRHALTDAEYLRQFEPAIRKFRERYFYQDHRKHADRMTEEIISLLDTRHVSKKTALG